VGEVWLGKWRPKVAMEVIAYIPKVSPLCALGVKKQINTIRYGISTRVQEGRLLGMPCCQLLQPTSLDGVCCGPEG
jgi:hypothetical protein